MMNARLLHVPALAASILLAACASGGTGTTENPSTSVAPNVGLAMTMCSEPMTLDTAGWHQTSMSVVKVKIPRGFHVTDQGDGYQVYSMGEHREAGLFWGRDPYFLVGLGGATIVSRCTMTISGHPAEVVLYRYTGQDNAMAPSGHAETVQIASARWMNVSGRDVILWISSPYRKDLDRYREMFWTAEFSKDAFGNQTNP